MSTVREKLEQYDLLDTAILSHGFAPYMRDYEIFVEAMWGEKEWGDRKGRYLYRFTHCPEAHLKTAVKSEFWREAWSDVFNDYQKWQEAGEPHGFVWAACWSTAYPGQTYIENSANAAHWSKEFEKPMHELEIETEAFQLRIVFYDLIVTKVSDEVHILDKVMFPLKSPPRAP